MAETVNISKMAEKLSDDIFSIFFWNKRGPANHNWNCVQPELHMKDTHPSDVVFWYDEPYQNVRTYVQTDLKSYKATSITKGQIENALLSLSQQVSCAEISDEYQSEYTHEHVDFEIVGLLFIFNHDGAYDRNFRDVLKIIATDKLQIPKGRRLFILGPAEIHWLNNVSHDIQWLRGGQKLPQPEHCTFFYPQLVEHAQVRGQKQCAATLETLIGPWIILKYESKPKFTTGYVIYYRETNSTVNEFMYLMDYMRQHDMLTENIAVEIRFINKDSDNPTKFQSAQQQYAEQITGSFVNSGGLANAVKALRLEPITNVIPTFSEEQIGMSNDR